jgi:hypothetical protein
LDKKPSRLLVLFHGLPLLALPLFPLSVLVAVEAQLPMLAGVEAN